MMASPELPPLVVHAPRIEPALAKRIQGVDIWDRATRR